MKFTLSLQCLVVLRSILLVPGVVSNVEEVYRCGRLMAEVLRVPREPLTDESMRVPTQIELDAGDLAFIRQAVDFVLSKRLLQASEWLNELVIKLGFVVKPQPPSA